MKKEVYLDNAEKDLERILTNMDRNSDSDTYGCLSRPFWHDKITDFPSAHQQIAILPLTIAYTQEWDENPFYQNKQIKEYINASIDFWCKIQKKNGSFDEHYPNEHSLGAVAWTLWAVTESCLMMENPPDIDSNVKRAVDFLRRNDEPGDIANHQAVSASALTNSHLIANTGMEGVKERIDILDQMQTKEGWFQEYIGADLGYQSTTISHMARVWSHDKNLVNDTMITNSLNFFSNFIDEKNYYSGIIGSRNTEHLHSTGFEIFADEFEKAKKIAGAVRINRNNNNLLKPRQMDDKHFSRQLAEYMDSYRRGKTEIDKFSKIDEQKYKPIWILKHGDNERIFLNVSKGGVYKKYKAGKFVEKNQGISVKRKEDSYTSNWPGVTDKVKKNGKKIYLEGCLRKVPRNTLPKYYFMVSRLFNYSLGKFPKLSLKAKNMLISILIDSDKSDEEFKREINLKNQIKVSDQFNGEKYDGKVRTNFVPSSEFFRLEHLQEVNEK